MSETCPKCRLIPIPPFSFTAPCQYCGAMMEFPNTQRDFAEAEARQAAKELYRELRYALHDLGVEDEVVKRALRRYAKFAPKEAADD